VLAERVDKLVAVKERNILGERLVFVVAVIVCENL